jgi:hypothetical protein
MNRALTLGLVLLFVAGCTLPDERASLVPLPENSGPVAYAELLTRARRQADAANEAFMVNKWSDLEEAAKTLEQTARFMSKASDVPEKHKFTLAATSSTLAQDATKLLENAKAKDVKEANETLRRVLLTVRELRLDN